MTGKTNSPKKSISRKLTPSELTTIAYIATLILAALALFQGIDTPVVWTFLGMAVGALLGQANESGKQDEAEDKPD